MSVHNLGWISDLKDLSKTLVVSVIAKTVEAPSCLGDLEVRSKILVGSVITKIPPNWLLSLRSPRYVQDTSCVGDLEGRSKILVGPVI